jgi:hypothetical protein
LRVRPEPTRVKPFDAPLLDGTNIRLGWKGLSGTNTQAY